ncbi:MAG: N(4)-(beta-N-acetylglucosaminyl)-L-asparaginase [Bacteroidota bacterium]
MKQRRRFLKQGFFGTLGLALWGSSTQAGCTQPEKKRPPTPVKASSKPMVLSTWYHGLKANEKALEILSAGQSALDAVEQGVMVTEADPESTSVGYGGLPDRDGNVTLDACIMDEKGNCGSVCFLQNIKHPISVARKVMENTPHVMFAGKGALQFALEQGFKQEDLLTKKSRQAWEKWKIKSEYKPVINAENHDTIGMIAIDNAGNLSGACTTSGMAYKMHGRVGDSPIIGAGLFVDNEVGAAVATGHGEKIIQTVGSFLIVELMRQGMHPQAACEEGIRRIIQQNPGNRDIQIGYLALNKAGEIGAFAVHKGFNFAQGDASGNDMVDAGYHYKD